MTPAVGLVITRAAVRSAAVAGAAALPYETGGVLIGFRTPDLVVVTRTLCVPDPRSSPHRYRRDRRRAQAQMAAAGINTISPMGYVGEWHTHPADFPPSRTDERALASTARSTGQPVALMVLAYRPDGIFGLYGQTALCESGPVLGSRRIRIFPVAPTVTDDTTDSLEAEATEAFAQGQGW